jgi:NTE family protein
MLEALYERGIKPDLIVGTSVGAINGAFISSRPQTLATVRELGVIWRGLRRGQLFPLGPIAGALGFIGARDHLVPDSGLRRLVRRHLSVERIEDTSVPLHLVATDVLRGEDVRLSEGPLAEALMASAAIPGVFPPVLWQGRQLIDGGVSNNVPLTHAIELGADRIYVLPTGAPCELEEAPRGAMPMLLYATGLLVGRRLNFDLATAVGDAEVIVLPPPCPLAVQPIDFSQADALIVRARREAERHLRRLDRKPAPRSVRPKTASGPRVRTKKLAVASQGRR